MVTASLLTACWPVNWIDDCERNATLTCFWDGLAASGSGPGGDGGTSPACIPSENPDPVDDTCGVFVATSGNDGNEGTKDKPLRTFAKAIELASKETKRVYACAEEFTEAVEVAEGLEIYGGLACKEGWSYLGAMGKTAIKPASGDVPLTLSGGDRTIHIEDVVAAAAAAAAAGGSSIAAIVDGGSIEFVRCELVAGAGMNGEKGETPTDSVGPTDPNDPTIKGQDGTVACMGPMSGNPGGLGAVNTLCSASFGGDGGKATEGGGSKGDDGAPLPDPNPDGGGLGGAGDTGSGCKSGEDGLLGTVGTSGTGATGLGTFDASGYTGASGTAGSPGAPGQGGGGGGGAKGKVACNGASGGGGGAGGCGGNGGKGGTAGGSSIALVSVNATLSFEDVVLTTGDGGAGGEGGDGQNGGVGGTRGTGGAAAAGTLPACDGGKGGVGGFGGKGGGGQGGHAIGIAYRGTAPPTSGATIKTGDAGTGGLGDGATGSGAAGVKANTQELP
jgi:hypothetical protein